MKRYFFVLVVPAVCLGTITPGFSLRHSDLAYRHEFHDFKSMDPVRSGSRALCFDVRSQSFANSVTFNVWRLGTFARSLALRLTGGYEAKGDDYYHILGVDKNCNEDEIRKAYR